MQSKPARQEKKNPELPGFPEHLRLQSQSKPGDWIADSVKIAITSALLFISLFLAARHPLSGFAETLGGELGKLACAWAG